jgi:hypothetical protein
MSRFQLCSWTTGPLKIGLIGRLEMLVQNYHSRLCNMPEEYRSHLRCGRSLSHAYCVTWSWNMLINFVWPEETVASELLLWSDMLDRCLTYAFTESPYQ